LFHKYIEKNIKIIPDKSYESQGEQFILLGIDSKTPEIRRPFIVKSPCIKKKHDIDFPIPQKEKGLSPFATECDNASLKVLVFRDSFFTALIPFFSEHFKKVVYSWDSFNQDEIDTIATKIQPDIVIEQSVERFTFRNYLPEVCHNILGKHFLNAGVYKMAVFHLRETMRIVQGLPDSHNNLGFALMQSGEIEEAITHFKKALATDSNNEKALRNLKAALAHPKRIDKTIAELKKKTKIHADDHWAHYILGRLFRKKGMAPEALSYFKKALAIKPDYIPVLESMVSLYAKQHNLEAAITYSHQLLKIAPDNKNTYYNIACLYARQNKQQAAVSWLKKAIETGYDNRDSLRQDKDLENIRNTSFYESLEL